MPASPQTNAPGRLARRERQRELRLATVPAAPPRGQQETVAALIDATIALLAERGPAATSVRDIAARAGVNHGLVHRHFGGKPGLVRAALDRLSSELFAAAGAARLDVGGFTALFAETARHEPYWRALARTVLDGEAPREFQSGFPTFRRVVEALHAMQRAGVVTRDLDPPLVAAALGALVLGWLVFEPFLVTATGLDARGRDDNRTALLTALLTILARLGDTPAVTSQAESKKRPRPTRTRSGRRGRTRRSPR